MFPEAGDHSPRAFKGG
uniref:Uncharacterized protein n=1 Tax=Anguilla anguilla TaxID=7936 RepID=A0A0E9Y1G0_ANGAN